MSVFDIDMVVCRNLLYFILIKIVVLRKKIEYISYEDCIFLSYLSRPICICMG